jgi:hypothetical protein
MLAAALAALLAGSTFATGPAAAAELQSPPVMDGSGAFLGAPGVTGPGYLAPDPVPLILDEFTPSARNPLLAEVLDDALRWANAAEQITQFALQRHANASSWAAFTDLRAKRSAERSSSLVAEVYRSGGDLTIFVEDLVKGMEPGRALHDHGIRTLLSDQLASRAATANELAVAAADERDRRREILTSTASAEIAARAWLGQLLALDRITAGTKIDELSMRALVELLASRLPALVDDAIAAQQLPALTTPDRRRALAATENLAAPQTAAPDALVVDDRYGALDLEFTGPRPALELLASRLPDTTRSVILDSAFVISTGAGVPTARKVTAPVTQLELIALTDDTGWLFDPVRFSTGSTTGETAPGSTPVATTPNAGTPSTATPNPTTPGVAPAAPQDEVTAAGVLLAASRQIFPGSKLALAGGDVTVTELHTSVFAPNAMLLDRNRFDRFTAGARVQHRLLLDVRTDAQGARLLAALRSIAPSLGVTVRSLTGAPEPSRFEPPENAAARLGVMPYTADASGKLNVPSSFTNAHVGPVSLPLLGRITCSTDTAAQMAGALAHLAVIGYATQIAPAEFGGCYNPRLVVGSNYPSFHARGLAIDLGVPANLQGSFGTLDPGLVSVFKSWGFRWGGDWVALDPMHFEAAALLIGE